MLLLLSYRNCGGENKTSVLVCTHVPNVVCALIITTNTELTKSALIFILWCEVDIRYLPLSRSIQPSFISAVGSSFSFSFSSVCENLFSLLKRSSFNCWTALDWLKTSRDWITARGSSFCEKRERYTSLKRNKHMCADTGFNAHTFVK